MIWKKFSQCSISDLRLFTWFASWWQRQFGGLPVSVALQVEGKLLILMQRTGRRHFGFTSRRGNLFVVSDPFSLFFCGVDGSRMITWFWSMWGGCLCIYADNGDFGGICFRFTGCWSSDFCSACLSSPCLASTCHVCSSRHVLHHGIVTICRWVSQLLTKKMIFRKKAKKSENKEFHLNDHFLESTQEYTYLGIKFTLSGNFSIAQEQLRYACMPFMESENMSTSTHSHRIWLKNFLTPWFPQF